MGEIDVWQVIQVVLTVGGAGVAAYVATQKQINGLRLQISQLRAEMFDRCETKRNALREELGGEIKEVTGKHKLGDQ